jgi:GMP synthase-like glutamine amidotransferase
VQHVPFEGPGSVRPWAKSRGHELLRALASDPATLPPPDRFDWLVLMGGPMGVHDTSQHPWLSVEKSLIRAALDAGRRVLGICLGAQLLAEALGARVSRAREREIGWFPVDRLPEAEDHPIGRVLPPRFTAFQWHGDTFDRPEGAVQLARSPGCEQQAFAIGGHVVGLQFHLEFSGETVQDLLRHCPGDLAPGPYVQTADRMLWEPARFEASHLLLDGVLDAMAATSPAGAAAAVPSSPGAARSRRKPAG